MTDRQADPFAALGLRPDPGLTDDDIRAAWRRIATATHPDRADGGEPAHFARAAAAYTCLRTATGRGEARADLAAAGQPSRAARPRLRRISPRGAWHTASRRLALPRRFSAGRPARLALRITGAALAGGAGALAAGPHPAAPALAVGAATWLVISARRDLGPPR